MRISMYYHVSRLARPSSIVVRVRFRASRAHAPLFLVRRVFSAVLLSKLRRLPLYFYVFISTSRFFVPRDRRSLFAYAHHS